ncbi:MAG: bifunctional oligoribonuclease/PAP phosphatase NrnA [Candidatus Eisenbacteria bacterium]|uniref:Bifunctional oligoribonuclease/PAP phosphatase NrnA n=1 Tax=Eiseniibacteriota bacterium TaxID=2212470 RepID=A0A948S0L1_UNCEI|nr:bifunctional oligoribonuclease/PAP phosphatase NrnA [Candidatus Eisenbacteria bacterium]MBU1947420.1 bifunctional oligoribonuclease/PAP phosphatase NrnA [Candidatus Eisenbacteria bacterium]MBU2693391.1 bifunctional oligoribonuclease/PAP phosphatase NrnA [Candidatus Eisenbacteria bacterium]
MNPSRQLQEVARHLQSVTSVMLTTHAQPDGDGIGSILALGRALEQLHIKVILINSDPTPVRFEYLDADKQIVVWREGAQLPEVDLILVLDTHNLDMLGGLEEPIAASPIPHIFLDHHPQRASLPGTECYCIPEASSTGELVFDLIHLLDIPLDAAMAECLYVSLTYDTNMFKYIRNQPRTLEVAADLIRAGANADRVYRHVFASNPPEKIKLLGTLLMQTAFACGGRLCYVDIPCDLFKGAGVTQEALRDIVTLLLEVAGVEIAVVFKETSPAEVKVSLRSKGILSINGIAAEFGGGGHPFASGIEMSGSLTEVRDKVLNRLCCLLESSPAGGV